MFLNVKNPVSLQVQSTFLIQTKLLRGWREASCYGFFFKKKKLHGKLILVISNFHEDECWYSTTYLSLPFSSVLNIRSVE